MKKRNSLTVIALLFVAVLTGVVVYNTMAKYTSEVSSTGSATVAKWNFTTDNTAQTYTMNFNDSADESTLVKGKIAPGTSGSFNVQLKNSSEVGVNVTVKLGNITASPSEEGAIPTGLKFYKTRTGSAGNYTYSNPITLNSTEITGKMAAKTGSSDVILPDLTIYWVWDYEVDTAGNTADTTAGSIGARLTIPVTITGTQATPSNTAITTGWN